jgi:hypothetical protein
LCIKISPFGRNDGFFQKISHLRPVGISTLILINLTSNTICDVIEVAGQPQLQGTSINPVNPSFSPAEG